MTNKLHVNISSGSTGCWHVYSWT